MPKGNGEDGDGEDEDGAGERPEPTATANTFTLSEDGTLEVPNAGNDTVRTGAFDTAMGGTRTMMIEVVEPVEPTFALSLFEAITQKEIAPGTALEVGAPYVSRAVLEAVFARAAAAKKTPSLATPVAFTKDAIYTSVDIVGSTNAQSVFFDPRCPAELRTEFIRLQGKIIEIVTTIIENFHGSADGFQGDEITATFPSAMHAYMASHAIKDHSEKSLKELRALIERFNRDHSGGGGTFEAKAGLRIVHTSAEGLLLANNPEVTGTIARGKAIKASKLLEEQAKSEERSLDPNTTNVFVEEAKAELFKSDARRRFLQDGDQYKTSMLRIGHIDPSVLASTIKTGTKLPTNEAASKHPNSTLAVPLCVYLPDVSDDTDMGEFQKLIGVIAATLREYQCEDIKSVAGGAGLFTTFENGETEELATKALQAVRRVIDEFNGQNLTSHRSICAIGRKDRVVRFRAGSEKRHELTRIGSVINEFFRGLAVAIDMYRTEPDNTKRKSLAVTLIAPERIKEYCEVLDTTYRSVKGVPKPIPVTRIGKIISKRRAVIIKHAGEIRIIGEGANRAAAKIKELFDGETPAKFIKIRGISPSIELLARKTLEREDTKALCLVKPEGQDAMKEYQTIFQIVYELINAYEIIGEDQEIITGHLALRTEDSIEKAMRHCLACVKARSGGILQICVLEAGSMDDSSRFALENAVRKIKDGSIRLIIAGANVEAPDIDEEDTETVTESEAKELVMLILKQRAGRVEGRLISDPDLDLIVGSFPKDSSGKVQGAYVFSWISELIANGDLYSGIAAAFEVNTGINQESYKKNTLLTRKLNALENETRGITEVAYAIAAVGRPVLPEDLAITSGARNAAAARLAAQGILIKVDVSEGGEASGEIETVEPNSAYKPQIGKSGYIIAPIYREAMEACLEGWEKRRMEVHGKIIKDHGKNAEALRFKRSKPDEGETEDGKIRREAVDMVRKRELKELRGICLMHYKEYFKYHSAEELDEKSCKWLTDYMETVMVDAKEELDLGNREKVARTMPIIRELRKILSKPSESGTSTEILKAKMTYLELAGTISSAAYRKRMHSNLLIEMCAEDSFEAKMAKELEAAELNIVMKPLIALIKTRGLVAKIENLPYNKIGSDGADQLLDTVEQCLNELQEISVEAGCMGTDLAASVSASNIARIVDTLVSYGYAATYAVAMLPDKKNTQKKLTAIMKHSDGAASKGMGILEATADKTMTDKERNVINKVTREVSHLLYVKIPNSYAEINGLSFDSMVEWYSDGQTLESASLELEKSQRRAVVWLIESALKNERGEGVDVNNIAYPLENDDYFRAINVKVGAILKEKRKAEADCSEWIKPMGVIQALGNYSENARKLARAYTKYDGDLIDGMDRKDAAINLLIKAKKAAEYTRALVDYDADPEGVFLYEHGFVYNIAEACVELAFLRKDTMPQIQKEFNDAMADMIKLRSRHGDSYKGRPIADDITRLYAWATKAGLDTGNSKNLWSEHKDIGDSMVEIEVIEDPDDDLQ